MSARTAEAPGDSLELLLDTICNTFGAVLFISILVAVLVSRQGKTELVERTIEPDMSLAVARVQADIARAESKIKSLRVLFDSQKHLTEKFADPQAVALARQLKAQMRQETVHRQQQTAAAQRNTNSQEEILRMQTEAEQQERSLRQVQRQVQFLQRQVTQAAKASSRTVRIPRQRKTYLTPVAFALDDNKLFRVQKPDGELDPLHTEKSILGSITLRQSAGLPVSDGDQQGAWSRVFYGIKKDQHLVSLWIANDAYNAFGPVQQFLVSRRLLYQVNLMDANSVQLFSSSRSGSAWGQ